MSGRELVESYYDYIDQPWGEVAANIRAGLTSWISSVPWSGESGPPPVQPYLDLFLRSSDGEDSGSVGEMSARDLYMLMQQRNRERHGITDQSA
jgi:hypothetical protein